MADKIIMLDCSAGMSTSLLVTKMQAAAKKLGRDYNIFATSVSDIDNQLENTHPDVLMLGPQVAYMKGDVKAKTDAAKIPMAVINMQDYGMMAGDKVLATAEQLLKEG